MMKCVTSDGVGSVEAAASERAWIEARRLKRENKEFVGMPREGGGCGVVFGFVGFSSSFFPADGFRMKSTMASLTCVCFC